MVNFNTGQIHDLMSKVDNIRNISVIAHVDHGKSTVIDCLATEVSTILPAKAGGGRYMDTHADEQERGITIKSTVIPMYFKLSDDQMEDISTKEHGNGFLINLVNSPGHAELSSEVTAALRITDGALVIVDAITGMSVQTETMFHQALSELVKPVVMINRIDHAMLKAEFSQEKLYQSFARVVENVNFSISAYQGEEATGNPIVSPELGTVAFGSALHGWAFTLRQFAVRYSKQFGINRTKIIEKLWGENYFNATTKEWSTKSADTSGNRQDRAFNMLILDPIYKIYELAMNSRKDEALAFAAKLDIALTSEERDTTSKALLKVIMHKFLPAAEALMEMICIHLPSPKKAQLYRCDYLYEGPTDDESATGIRNCDPNGPLMFYVSKLLPASDMRRFYAFGRVFSGTVSPGMRVRIQGPDYVPGNRKDLHIKPIQRTVFMVGRGVTDLDHCSAGNIVSLVGIDQFLLKSGTLTTSDTAHNMKTIKFSVSPVMQVAVGVQDPKNLPNLLEGLKRLSRSDPCIHVSVSESGEYTIAGAGELYLEACLSDLENDYARVPIIINCPVVNYYETVQATSSLTCMSKSANKHNRIYMQAAPISDELTKAIEEEEINPHGDAKERARRMANDFEWDSNEARKIWCFAPDDKGPNILVNSTAGIQYLDEIKDMCCGGLQAAAHSGPCAGEKIRGCRFNIMDVVLHADSIHRGNAQIMPTMRAVIYASMLSAKPTLQEPVYLVDVQCPSSLNTSICSVFSHRRGQVIEVNTHSSSMCNVKAYLPVAESFGFTAYLRSATAGQAFPQMVFDHWSTMNGDVTDPADKINAICRAIRKRKGVGENVPTYGKYHEL
ncbi:translation elongation factor 2 [Coemansia spiralis]|uniref:Elongation factor 2 n=1 Tax=Coemansia spiralis TaxID=417178 RepID=A0A9W8KW19_9FUNG|nr:translation elongation factor 2 [Coemansia spiralis]